MGKIKNKLKKFLSYNSEYDVQNKELFHYATGVAGQNITYNLVASWFEYFCNMILFIKPLHTGTIVWLARGWDAINDPLAGSIIDKHQFKSGEKLRPYIRMTSIPIGILSALLFVNFGLASYGAKVLYVLTIYLLWDTLYSFQDIAQWGMVARITNIPERRDKAAYFGRIGGSIGSWLPGLIPLMIGLSIDGKINISLTQMFIILGIVFGLGGMILSMVQLKCNERAPVLPPEGNIFAGLKLIRQNKIVIALTIGSVLSSLTLTISDIYFFQYMISLNIGSSSINGATILFAFGLITGLPGMLAMFFTPFFARKLGGMKNILVISSITTIICRVAMYIVGYQGAKFYIMALLFAIMNVPNAMRGIASTALWGDSLDFIEWKTGQRNEGTVFAFQNFIAKIGGSLSALFTGITLTLLKFNPEAMSKGAPLSQEFIRYSWLIFALGPALGTLLGLIPLLALKYNLKERDRIAILIKERREGSKEEQEYVAREDAINEALNSITRKVDLPY